MRPTEERRKTIHASNILWCYASSWLRLWL